MEVDKVLQEYVESVKKSELQEIDFTPALEKKIREKITMKKKKVYRYLSSAAVAAALLAVSVPVYQGLSSVSTGTGDQIEEQSVKSMTKAEEHVFTQIKQALPELQQYRFDRVESFFAVRYVVVRKSEGEMAQFAVDQTTGQLLYFSLGSAREKTEREADSKVAQERATAFLRAVVEKGASYKLASTGPAFEVLSPQDKGTLIGTNVLFKPEGTSEFPLDGDATVRVDAAGNVTGYFQIGQFDQPVLEKMFRQVPELKEYQFDSKMAYSGGYSLILRKNEKEYASIGFDAVKGEKTGILGGFELVKAEGNQNQPAVSESVMTEKAQAFGKEMLGDEYDGYRMQRAETFATKLISVNFQRYVNDLQVQGDSWSVTFDTAGTIVSYNRSQRTNYAANQFADPSEVISKDAAEKELASHMKLTYRIYPEPILEYVVAANSSWEIDGKTGKILYNPLSQRSVPSSIVFDESSESPIKLDGEKEQLSVKSKAEALALLKKEFAFDPTGFDFQEHEDKDTNQQTYSWQEKGNERGKNAVVIVDKATGSINQISMFRFGSDKKIKGNREEAQREAIRFLAKYADPDVTEAQLSEVIEAGQGNGYTASDDWGFGFYRSHNGVAITDNRLCDYYVGVDPSSNKVVEFIKQYKQDMHFRQRAGQLPEQVQEVKLADLPDSKKVVSAQEAAKEYLNYYDLKLVYVEGKNGPVLVYQAFEKDAYKDKKGKQIRIDAVTGKAVLK